MDGGEPEPLGENGKGGRAVRGIGIGGSEKHPRKGRPEPVGVRVMRCAGGGGALLSSVR